MVWRRLKNDDEHEDLWYFEGEKKERNWAEWQSSNCLRSFGRWGCQKLEVGQYPSLLAFFLGWRVHYQAGIDPEATAQNARWSPVEAKVGSLHNCVHLQGRQRDPED
jgi:hypothetical protein